MARTKKKHSTDQLKLIYLRLVEGVDDFEIAAELGVEEEDFDRLKVEALKAKALEYKQKPPEHVYVEYVIEQKKTLALLEQTIRDLRESGDPKAGPAIVSAIKARSDVLNCIVEKGQTLGMVAKSAEVTKVVGGFVFEQLGRDDMKSLIMQELAGLKRIMDTSAIPIEQVTLPPTHYGDRGDENAVIHIADDSDD